jgi:hypothetical protein
MAQRSKRLVCRAIRVRRAALAVGLTMMWPVAALAQNEEALRSFFEGKHVVVKMDMPGDVSGVEISPEAERPVDYRALGSELKSYGAALHKGDETMVTKVHLKGKSIEFQLGGGGYGTFGDVMAEPSTPSTYVGKSQRERDLEDERKNTNDPDQIRWINRELDALQRQRARESAQLKGQAAAVDMSKDAQRLVKRSQAGSRFNLLYKKAVPPEAKTPEGLMAALGEYVDFSPGAPPAQVREQENPGPAQGASDPVTALKKGMSEAEVDQVLGQPASKEIKEVEGMKVANCTYLPQSMKVSARFVNGVLTEFTLSSR